MSASGAQHMTSTKNRKPASATSGIVLHSPAFYDFILWLLMRGKEASVLGAGVEPCPRHGG